MSLADFIGTNVRESRGLKKSDLHPLYGKKSYEPDPKPASTKKGGKKK